MKKTKKIQTLLSVLLTGFLVSSAMGATTDNYSENFEGYAVGDLLAGTNGWSADDSNAVVVAGMDLTTNYSGAYPIIYDHATMTNVLQIESTVTNTIDAGTVSQTNWVDMMIRPVISDETPAFPTGAVAACYFNTNNNLVVLHTPSANIASGVWIEIPDVSVGSNEWIRLTIAANMKDGVPLGDNTRFYQLYINGVVVTNSAAFQLPKRSSGSNGSWFGSAAALTQNSISNVIFQGTGYLDDLVVTNGNPMTQEMPTVEAWPTADGIAYGETLADALLSGGSVTNSAGDAVIGTFVFTDSEMVPPAGTNTYAAQFNPDDLQSYSKVLGGMVEVVVSSKPLLITANSFNKDVDTEYTFDGTEYDTDVALISGDSITNLSLTSAGAVSNAALGDYDIIVSGAEGVGLENYTINYSKGTMTVATASTETTVGTPHSWYNQFLPAATNSYEDLDNLDSDSDGLLNWQEFVAGTIPSDSNSVFKLLSATVSPSNVVVTWIGGTNGPVAPYKIESVASLETAPIGWSDMTNMNSRTEGTNTWTSDSVPEERTFYRVGATGD